jgi:phosphoserine phosphatase RsbU/P
LHARDVAALRGRLEAVERELDDLRAIRDALTPPELPQRPGLELAAAFPPAAAEHVSGDFYLVVEGPRDSTVLVVGHGVQAGRRAAFVRTAFAATAPFSDDPAGLLSWANTALTERAGTGSDFVTAACVTCRPGEGLLRWAYAGHPPALWLDDGRELIAPRQGTPLGIPRRPRLRDGSAASAPRRGRAALHRRPDRSTPRRNAAGPGRRERRAQRPSTDPRRRRPSPACARAAACAHGTLTDDVCLLAARIT